MPASLINKTFKIGFIIYSVSFSFLCGKANSEILFEEVTDISGISHTSRSFGAAWCDFNGDGYVDLFTNNHQNKPNLFLNQKDGSFIDVYDQWIGINNIFEQSDQHGASCADFDNDGDQDLIVLVGGNGGGSTSANSRNHLYTNEGTFLLESSVALGVDLPNARGRSPLWLDYDNNGLLDLALSNMVSNGTPITTLYEQINNVFIDNGPNLNFQISENTHALQLTDITNSGNPELVAFSFDYGLKAYDFMSPPFTDITANIIANPAHARGNGSIWADFNNDFKPDLFVPLGAKPLALTQITSDEIHFGIFVSNNNKELSFSFTTDSDTAFQLAAPWHRLTDVYIGTQKINPTAWTFTLNPNDSLYHGLPAYIPDVDRGIYIGYDPATLSWTVVLNTDTVIPGASDSLHGIITSNANITNISTFGFDANPRIWTNKLLINTGTDLVNMANNWGVGEAIPSISSVAGDFDNDMDIDLYVVNSLGIANYPNRLYENIGGYLSPVVDAGGASGSVFGIGQNVAVADYDQDGFLDLYVMNGGSNPPFSEQGNHQLFRNTGNNNHWIEIDLEGVASNRSAIGAKLLLTAGGVTQWREQNGKMHYYSQDHNRIHFGLGTNTSIDELKIIWPNGDTQTHYNIPADQILHLTEEVNAHIFGQPLYTPGIDSGTFIWKEYFDTPYRLRTVSSNNSQAFDIALLSNATLVSAAPVSVENNDVFTANTNGFTFQRSSISSLENGIDFELQPGAHALISVSKDTVSNPRNLYIGQNQSHIPPKGWVINISDLGSITDFVTGKTVTTRMGSDQTGSISFRTSANRFRHNWSYDIFYENAPVFFDPIFLENGDSYFIGEHALNIKSLVQAPWRDGFNITFQQNELLGIHLDQDGIFQSHPGIARNINGTDLPPNAYWLPIASPYGDLQYDPGERAALYIWKDETDDFWHLRFTAGGGNERFIGSITSSQPFAEVSAFSLESSDSLITSTDTKTIDFSLKVANVWHDGIDLRIQDGASLVIDLTQGGNGSNSVFIGEKKWPISSLPINLTGW